MKISKPVPRCPDQKMQMMRNYTMARDMSNLARMQPLLPVMSYLQVQVLTWCSCFRALEAIHSASKFHEKPLVEKIIQKAIVKKFHEQRTKIIICVNKELTCVMCNHENRKKIDDNKTRQSNTTKAPFSK